MDFYRLNDVVGFEPRPGNYLAFHGRNLELAELTPEAWAVLTGASSELGNSSPAALSDLQSWERQTEELEDLKNPHKIRFFSINVAQICNLGCSYCGATDGSYGSKVAKTDVSIVQRQLALFVSRLSAGESFHVRFLGGEPLLYPGIIESLARYLRLLVAGRDIPLEFSIITNGTLITPKVAALLADLKASVTVSWDGPEDINDRVRPAKSKNFKPSEKIIEGLGHLSRVRDQLSHLKVNAIFGAHNMDLSRSYLFLREYPFDEINLGYASNPEDAKYSPLYIDELKKVAREARQRGGAKELARISQFLIFLEQLETPRRRKNFCGAGKSLLQADTRGDLFACNWLMNDPSEKIGSGVDIEQKKLEHWSQDLIDLNKCQGCWARYLCGGGCIFVNKERHQDKHQKDGWFCYRIQNLILICIEHFAELLQEEGNHETH